VNLSMVEYVGIGKEIVSGPDAGAVFGQQAAQLPQGAQALPMNAGNPGNAMPGQMPGMPQQQQQQFAPPGYQQPQQQQQFAPPGGPGSPMPTFAPPAVPSMMPGGAPGAMPGQQFQPPGNPAPLHPNNPAAGAPPQQFVQPHPGILQGPGVSAPPQQQFVVPGVPMAAPGQMPGMPGMMPQQQFAPPPVVHQMTPLAQGYTYEQFIAQGHNDASLRAQGLML